MSGSGFEAPLVYPRADLGTLRVRGAERASWLNGLITCDVNQVKPGIGQFGLALDRKGKIQSVLWVLDAGEELLVATSPGTAATLHVEFDRMLIMEDAELEEVSTQVEWAMCWGDVPEVDAAALASGSLALGTLHVRVVANARQEPPNRLTTAPRMTDAQWLCRRLEHGLPEFGVDFSSKDRPHEAGLERRAVNWSKGCYLGQEVVCMQDMRGKVSRQVSALRIDAAPDAPLVSGVAVEDRAGAQLGTLSSVALVRGTWLALCRLPVAALSAELFVSAGGRWPAGHFRPVADA